MQHIAQQLMAILFMSPSPIPLWQLKEHLGISQSELDSGINILKGILLTHTPFFLYEIEDSIKLCTRPEFSEIIKTLPATPKPKKLTDGQLETLVIVAYKQPIAKDDIDSIRGKNSYHHIVFLVEHGFVTKHNTDVGVMYTTSQLFLEYLGLKSLSDLPVLNDSKIDNLLNIPQKHIDRENADVNTFHENI